MKKIITILFVFFSLSVAIGYNPCEPFPACEDPLYEGESTNFGLGHVGNNTNAQVDENIEYWKERCPNIAKQINTENIYYLTELDGGCCFDGGTYTPKCICPEDKRYTDSSGEGKCCSNGIVKPDSNNNEVCVLNTEGNLGININSNCLKNGQCSFNIYKTLGIRKSNENPKVSDFVQDIVLAVTSFLGTVITLILVVSGILYILAGMQGKSSLADTAKKGIINSILGLILVTGSYAIIRLIQFVATAGGG